MKLKSQKKVKIRKGTKPYIKRKWILCTNLHQEEVNFPVFPAPNKLFPSLLQGGCFHFWVNWTHITDCWHANENKDGDEVVHPKEVNFIVNIFCLSINFFHLWNMLSQFLGDLNRDANIILRRWIQKKLCIQNGSEFHRNFSLINKNVHLYPSQVVPESCFAIVQWFQCFFFYE